LSAPAHRARGTVELSLREKRRTLFAGFVVSEESRPQPSRLLIWILTTARYTDNADPGLNFSRIPDPSPLSWDPSPLFGDPAPKLGDPLP